MLKSIVTGLTAAVSIALLASPASGQDPTTDTKQFQVSIHVQRSCVLTVNDLSFGIVTSLTEAHAATATGKVTCTVVSPGQVTFDAGTGGGNLQTRRMKRTGSQETIEYNVYRNAAHTEILGDGTNGTVPIPIQPGDGELEVEFTVYGQTAANQTAVPGDFSSTITATFHF